MARCAKCAREPCLCEAVTEYLAAHGFAEWADDWIAHLRAHPHLLLDASEPMREYAGAPVFVCESELGAENV